MNYYPMRKGTTPPFYTKSDSAIAWMEYLHSKPSRPDTSSLIPTLQVAHRFDIATTTMIR